jgi:hypothetical protein
VRGQQLSFGGFPRSWQCPFHGRPNVRITNRTM